MKSPTKKSPVALAVLALLYEEPMHPYKMWQLIKERAKDEVVNVRHRASLYQTIDRLEHAGLIAVKAMKQEEGRPEQTIYKITESGKQTALSWMRQMLSEPVNEFPEFPVALAHLPMLAPEEACMLLEERVEKLRKELERITRQTEEVSGYVPRLFLLESEFTAARLNMEVKWVNTLIDDLKSGRITWSEEWLREIAARFGGDS